MFNPPLPKRIVGTIDGLGAGLLDKVVLKFEKVWWPSDTGFSSILVAETPTTSAPPRGAFRPYPLYVVNAFVMLEDFIQSSSQYLRYI
ncbi:hypothetical protein M427DRAFT_38158 [Gonapodya prolifera JEL478]|uniref:Uncharacterized protein n=1 Tax=Gonapodya prolifera (strain JEL478) TaxID=1344416 RepID=A0A138ZZI6_GONPJ|nr:hypothetical protein M427DRAFT_38158 [Gonapodya prolifera JEL478]|eukprot:KXS09919.1 hypothetical protein M427DRAFT_38158 [Gonapodya prolifera JEL478]